MKEIKFNEEEAKILYTMALAQKLIMLRTGVKPQPVFDSVLAKLKAFHYQKPKADTFTVTDGIPEQ